jgi:hypothetical protein
MFCIKDFREKINMKRITLSIIGLALLFLSGLVLNAQFPASKPMAADKNLFAAESVRKSPELSAFAKKETTPKRIAARRRASKFAGKWKGILYQPDGTLRAKFNFTMRFYQKGKKISGFSRISISDAPQYYGVMRLTGTTRKNRLSFTESRVIKENLAPDSSWCIKSGKLKLTNIKGTQTLRGNWRGAATCSPGTIVLRKVSGK